ncbi:MAG: alpha/beta fold hydrolase [Thermoanaerobaculia bacterium]|jgi:pimeloyl-ACP methyl ester carboxylesterase
MNISIVRFFMLPLIAHRLDGDGPPLLLLNGGMMSIGAWDPIALPLARSLRVIRCDLRGQYLSPFDDAWTLADHAADVVALLDHLGVERVHLAGTSFGGEVAMIVAADHPDRVASLAVMTATDRLTPKMRAAGRALGMQARAVAEGSIGGGTLFRALAPGAFSERWLAEQPPGFLEIRARLFDSFPRPFFNGVASIMDALLGLDLETRLPRIVAPTLVIGAALDRTFPIEHSRAIAAAIPGARLEILENCGHAAVVEDPVRVAALLGELVASVTTP